eukprot:1247111-Rhodomonas_salina.2
MTLPAWLIWARVGARSGRGERWCGQEWGVWESAEMGAVSVCRTGGTRRMRRLANEAASTT